MSLGLVPYVLGTPCGRSSARHRAAAASPRRLPAAQPARDPWNRWSFRVNLNGNANGESSSKLVLHQHQRQRQPDTDESKINLNSSMNYRESKFELPDGRTFLSPNRDYGVNGLYVKSLDSHWSAGVRSNWNSSTFSNQNWSWSGRAGDRMEPVSRTPNRRADSDLQLFGEVARSGIIARRRSTASCTRRASSSRSKRDVDAPALGHARVRAWTSRRSSPTSPRTTSARTAMSR